MKFISICVGIIILQITLLAPPAFAEEACDDLWYSRNFYFDKAGYCFGSALGKAVFDNANCKSKDVSFSDAIKLRISHIKQTEKMNECKVSSKKVRNLDIYNFDMRKKLADQPINHGYESSCFGYQGDAKVPLYSAMSEGSEIMGYVGTGDSVYSAHDEISKTKWWFATRTNEDGKIVIGWTNQTIFDQCKAVAG